MSEQFRESYARILNILLVERASLDKTIEYVQDALDNWPVAP